MARYTEKNVENAGFTWGESSSGIFLLAAARQKTIIRVCQGYAAATGVFPLWLTERFSPKISKRTVLSIKTVISPSSPGQNGQG